MSQSQNILQDLQRDLESRMDFATVFGWDDLVTARMLRERYDRGDVIGALVNARPNATWGGEHDLLIDGRESPELEALADAFNLWDIWAKLDLAQDITRGAVAVIPGEGDQPTPEEAEGRIAVYGLDDISWDPSGNFYPDGRPEFYRLNPSQNRGGAVTQRQVNGLRCFHFADTRYSKYTLESNPALSRNWNMTDAWIKVAVGGGPEAYQRGAMPQIAVTYPEGKPPREEERKTLRERLIRYALGKLRAIETVGTKIERQAPQPVDFANNGDFLLKAMAVAWRVPLSIVVGEASVLDGATVNLIDWHERIDEEREFVARNLIAPYLAWWEGVRMGLGGVIDPMAASRVSVDWQEWPEQESTPGEGESNAEPA